MTTTEITEAGLPAMIADNDIVFLDFGAAWGMDSVRAEIANPEVEVVR